MGGYLVITTSGHQLLINCIFKTLLFQQFKLSYENEVFQLFNVRVRRSFNSRQKYNETGKQ